MDKPPEPGVTKACPPPIPRTVRPLKLIAPLPVATTLGPTSTSVTMKSACARPTNIADVIRTYIVTHKPRTLPFRVRKPTEQSFFALIRSNENKLSDGHRERASLEVMRL